MFQVSQISQIGNLHQIEIDCIYVVLATYTEARFNHKDANLSFNELNNDYEFNNIEEYKLASDRLIDSIDIVSWKEENAHSCINAIRRFVEKRAGDEDEDEDDTVYEIQVDSDYIPESEDEELNEIIREHEHRMATYRERDIAFGLPGYESVEAYRIAQVEIARQELGYDSDSGDEADTNEEIIIYESEEDEEIIIYENDGNVEWV